MAENLISIGAFIIFFCIPAFAWSIVFKKAGYSVWLGLLMAIPLVNVIMFIVFVFQEWPIENHLAEMMVRCGCGSQEEAYSVLKSASKLELAGRNKEAMQKYQLLTNKFSGTSVGSDAERCIESLQDKI